MQCQFIIKRDLRSQKASIEYHSKCVLQKSKQMLCLTITHRPLNKINEIVWLQMFRGPRLVRQARLKLNKVKKGKVKGLKGADILLSTKKNHPKLKSGASNKIHRLCPYVASLGKIHQVGSKIRKASSSKQVKRSVSKVWRVKNSRLRNLVVGRSSKLSYQEQTLIWRLKEQHLTTSQKIWAALSSQYLCSKIKTSNRTRFR